MYVIETGHEKTFWYNNFDFYYLDICEMVGVVQRFICKLLVKDCIY
jgi:hypothetical protein